MDLNSLLGLPISLMAQIDPYLHRVRVVEITQESVEKINNMINQFNISHADDLYVGKLNIPLKMSSYKVNNESLVSVFYYPLVHMDEVLNMDKDPYETSTCIEIYLIRIISGVLKLSFMSKGLVVHVNLQGDNSLASLLKKQGVILEKANDLKLNE